LEHGEFDLVLTSPDNVLAYHFLSGNPLGRNIPIEILSAIDRGLGLSLCLAPTIADVGQLRGEVVGVDVKRSGFAFVAYALLERVGLGPGDYVVEELGSTPRRARALIDHECSATILNAGNELRAQGRGCTIVNTASELGPYLGTVIAALASGDDAQRELQQRFTAVMRATMVDIIDGKRHDATLRAAMSLLDLSEHEAGVHYQRLLDRATGLIPEGCVDRASIETLVTLRQKYLPAPELELIMGELEKVLAPSARC
jgi:ABC-type nitrate/sulfonate/bicarbonate transport system substrate-binding protein